MIFRIFIFLMVFFSSHVFSAQVSKTCGIDWDWESPHPQGISLYGLVWSSEQRQYVAVGGHGTIITSLDGINMQQPESNREVTSDLNSIIWSGSQFVAVGENGTITLSRDAQSWEKITTNSDLSLNSLAYNGNQYVAVGNYNGGYLISTDGRNWQAHTIGIEGIDAIKDIIWANNKFTAIADGGYILTSVDGLSWTATQINTGFNSRTILSSITSNGSQYIAVGGQYEDDFEVRLIVTSNDGINWSVNATKGLSLLDVIWNGSQYLISSTDHFFLSGKDGINWSEKQANLSDEYYSLAWDGQQYLAVGFSGTIASSSDGISWQQRSSGETVNLYSIKYLNDQFIAIGETSYNIFTSKDGQQWESVDLKDSDIQDKAIDTQWADILDISFNGNRYVMLRSYEDEGKNISSIVSSSNLRHWKTELLIDNIRLSSLVWNGQQFIAVGINLLDNTSIVYRSSDGKNWEKTSTFGKGLNHIAWKNQLLIAVGNAGTIISSSNGVDWTDTSQNIDIDLSGLDASESLFVIVGKQGLILTSKDGKEWEKQFSDTSKNLQSILWNQSQFTVVGGDYYEPAIVLVSQDAKQWQLKNIQSNYLLDLAWDGNQQLVAVGLGGNILSSECYSRINFQNTRVILVAGGGDESDPLWPAINNNSNYAYRVLQLRGISRKNIRYLSNLTDQDVDGDGDSTNDVFAKANSATLEDAITNWATNEVGPFTPLLIYLIDHGGPKRFYIEKPSNDVADILTPTTLAKWLNDLQKKTSARTTLIYDACNSGSFMADLAVPAGENFERINIFSAKDNQVAYFGSQGQISFSSFFWSNTSQGYNVRESFRKTQTAIRSSTQNGTEFFQSAVFDDNGDGIFDSHSDGSLARATQLGIDAVTAAVFPQIISNSTQGNLQLKLGDTVQLFAKPDLPNSFIQRVWVMLNPPNISNIGEIPIIDTPMVELIYNAATERYEQKITINSDYVNGQYTLSYYAMDSEGLVSQEPIINFMDISLSDSVDCISQASSLKSDSLLLYINELQFNSDTYNIGFKYIANSQPIQFVYQYHNQTKNNDYCNIANATLSSSGVLTIPSILFDNSIVIKNVIFQLKENLIIELQSVE